MSVTLSYDEALVLSDLLSRRVDKDRIIDQLNLDEAERRLILDLAASFEPIIDEVFSHDYANRVERARAALRPHWSDE